jgi:membrane-associated phospholipid phosphatase
MVALALVAAAAVLLVVEEGSGLPGEQRLNHWARHSDALSRVDQLWWFFGAAGTPVVAAVTVAIAVWIAWRRQGPEAARYLVAAMGGPVLASVAKVIIGPTEAWEDSAHSLARNFPSGHVVYATAFFGALALLIGPSHRELRTLLWVLVAAMGPARVLLGSHLVGDVLAGYAIGFAWLLVIEPLRPNAAPATTPGSRGPGVAAAGLLPGRSAPIRRAPRSRSRR